MVRQVDWPSFMCSGGKLKGDMVKNGLIQLPWYIEVEMNAISSELLAVAEETDEHRLQIGLGEIAALATSALDRGDYQRYNFRKPKTRRPVAPLDALVADAERKKRRGE